MWWLQWLGERLWMLAGVVAATGWLLVWVRRTVATVESPQVVPSKGIGDPSRVPGTKEYRQAELLRRKGIRPLDAEEIMRRFRRSQHRAWAAQASMALLVALLIVSGEFFQNAPSQSFVAAAVLVTVGFLLAFPFSVSHCPQCGELLDEDTVDTNVCEECGACLRK